MVPEDELKPLVSPLYQILFLHYVCMLYSDVQRKYMPGSVNEKSRTAKALVSTATGS